MELLFLFIITLSQIDSASDYGLDITLMIIRNFMNAIRFKFHSLTTCFHYAEKYQKIWQISHILTKM